MKKIKLILLELVLPFILCWFFMSVLVDIVTIPTVFKNVSNLEEGGKIGMTVFHRFNLFEIFFGVFITLGIFLREKKSKGLMILSIGLLSLACFYTFYMTPTIAQAGIRVHQIAVTDPMYEVLQKEHTTFHVLYRNLDTAKLFILLFFAGVMIRLNILHKERA